MKTLVCVAVVGMASSVAAEIDRSGMVIYSGEAVQTRSLSEATPANRGVPGTFYSNMDSGSGFQAFPADTGVLGTADYVSTAAGPITLSEFRFVGGVANAGEVYFFDFFDTAGNFVDGFGVQASMGGNFIYTITIGSEVIVENAGFVQMSADDGSVLVASTGQWFLSDALATIGDQGLADANPGLDHKFEITGDAIPAPASAAVLGLAGLAARRRR